MLAMSSFLKKCDASRYCCCIAELCVICRKQGTALQQEGLRVRPPVVPISSMTTAEDGLWGPAAKDCMSPRLLSIGGKSQTRSFYRPSLAMTSKPHIGETYAKSVVLTTARHTHPPRLSFLTSSNIQTQGTFSCRHVRRRS